MKKAGLLKPFEICEYAEKCTQFCAGQSKLRNNTFSCGLRRGLLMSEGYEVIYGTDNVE